MTRRGALVLLILLISAGLAASLYVGLVARSSIEPGGPSVFGPPPLTLGSPTETTDGPTTSVSFPVGGAGGSLSLEKLSAHVADVNGRNISAQPDWNLTFDSATGDVLGVYSWSHGEWLVGGTLTLTTEDSFLFSLATAEAHQLVGDSFVLSGTGLGAFHGQCLVVLP